MTYRILPADEAYWRPSNQMGVLNTDLAKQLAGPELDGILGLDDVDREAPPPHPPRALRAA